MVLPTGSYFARGFAYNTGIPVELKEYSDPSNEVALTIPAQPAPMENLTGRKSVTAMFKFDLPDDQVAVVRLSFEEK